MRRVLLTAAVIALGVGTAGPAAAGPIVDGPNVGGLTTFQDLATGRVWADLNNFFDLSYNDMKAAVEAAGFTVATRADVQELLDTLPLDNPPVEWTAYAAIMGRAPNRDLIWGAYVPEEDPAIVSWAFAFSDYTEWVYTPFSGFPVTDVPNGGSSVADMNIWAFVGGPAAVPEPASLVLGAVGLAAVGARRLRRRTA